MSLIECKGQKMEMWKSRLLIALTLSGIMGAPCMAQGQPNQYEMRTEKQQTKRMKEIAKLTLDAATKAVSVTDDPFEPVVTLSSESVFPNPRSFSDRVLGENFFRAFVNRDTGRASFQLYQTLSYLGDWRRFDRVNIMLPGGLRTVSVTDIDHEIRQCYSINMCGRLDTVGFDLSEEDMEAIAAMKPGANGDPAIMRFRFKSATSFDWTDDIPAVEAAGILLALKKWREAKGIETDE